MSQYSDEKLKPRNAITRPLLGEVVGRRVGEEGEEVG